MSVLSITNGLQIPGFTIIGESVAATALKSNDATNSIHSCTPLEPQPPV